MNKRLKKLLEEHPTSVIIENGGLKVHVKFKIDQKLLKKLCNTITDYGYINIPHFLAKKDYVSFYKEVENG